MIQKWFEAFMLLERKSAADGKGGEVVTYGEQAAFQGALTYCAGEASTAGGQFALAENPALLHEWDVTLAPGNYVRREKDGAVYRVTDFSDRLRAPAFSGLGFCQVPVERVVIPC